MYCVYRPNAVKGHDTVQRELVPYFATNTCVQARLYTELRIKKPFDSFYPAFETLSVRLSLKSGNQSNFPMSSD